MTSYAAGRGLGEAPRGIAWPATWASGDKEFFGTSFESRDANGNYTVASETAPVSKVWFTGAQGVLSELYWPTLDRKQMRDLQFLITDSQSYIFEERTQAVSRTEWSESGVPAFVVKTSDPSGRFEIEKTIFSDPDRDVVRVMVRFQNFSTKTLSLYSLINPAIGNTPYGDSARADSENIAFWQEEDAMVLKASPGFKATGVGFSGTEDPFQDLKRDFKFDHHYKTATDGNVVGLGMMGEIPAQSVAQFELAISFASTVEAARENAILSLAESRESLEKYTRQWKTQIAKLPKFLGFGERSEDLYFSSVATLRSLEDKTFAGAYIASPSVPWGLQKKDPSANYTSRRDEVGDLLPAVESETAGIGAYHLVWPRDLFQMAQSFIAINDLESAKASLNHLKHMQFGPEHGDWEYGSRRYPKNGSFVQNAWIHGEAYWRMLQIDQVAYPVMLAHDLWRLGAIRLENYSDMVFRAADFIERFGPWSYQERWEENMGVSPSGIAAQIAALRKAIPMARAMRDEARANAYYQQAERLNNNLETWTFTNSGPVGDGNYFLRVVGASGVQAPWNPNSLSMIPITNGGERLIEKSVLDGGFIELVRHGVRSALDPSILATLPDYDLSLKDMIDGKPAFRRYVGDRYNWDEHSGRQTNGMPWPFLTGERAIYELKAAVMSANSNESLTLNFLPYANAFESFASDSFMFPEQVWSSGPNRGKGTGAATPLGWAHGEYIQMLKEYNSLAIGAVQNGKPSLQ